MSLLILLKGKEVSDMLPQCYEIVIKDNNLAIVSKIEHDTYKILEKHFEYLYHTKNGDTYPLDKDSELGRDILLVDDDHLYELLDDLREQLFCDTVEFNYFDEYGYDPYLDF